MIANKIYHGVEISQRVIPEHIVTWLNERIGKENWFVRGGIDGRTIYFDNERDHFLFLMTWGQSD